MSAGQHPVVRTPVDQRLKRARVGLLPLLTWIGGVFLAAQLWLSGATSPTYHGLAHGAEQQVSSPVDGELSEVLVELYQSVAAGDPLVLFDDGPLQASIATARAEIEQLAAVVLAQRAALEVEDHTLRHGAAARHQLTNATFALEYPAELRAFHATEAGLELGLLNTRLDITTSEIEADRLEVNLERARTMAAGSIGSRAEVVDLQKRLELERARAQGLKLIEASTRAELEGARARRNSLTYDFETPPAESLPGVSIEERLAGWKAAVAVQEKRLEELALLRESYLMRAPGAGRVASLSVSAGQHLLSGDPILVLLDATTDEVEVWVSEAQPLPPRIGDRFLVSRALQTDRSAECVVQAVSPGLELLPQRLWRDPRVAEYGRACLLGPAEILGLAPGERVRIDPLPEPADDER